MQSQKRAILVGEATAGAANPGDVFKINSDLEIFIPTGTSTNPVTKKIGKESVFFRKLKLQQKMPILKPLS